MALREEPEKGPALAEPAAARRPRARAARGFTESDFRRLCAVLRREAAAQAFDSQAELLAHVQRLADASGMPCTDEALARLADVLASAAAVQTRRRRGDAREERALVARVASDVAGEWRRWCVHRPSCATPTLCGWRALRTATGKSWAAGEWLRGGR